MITFLNYLFFIGFAVVAVNWLFQMSTKQNYNVRKARIICIIYVIGFAASGYGSVTYFPVVKEWWQTGIMVLCFVLAGGALLESRRQLPLAGKVFKRLE